MVVDLPTAAERFIQLHKIHGDLTLTTCQFVLRFGKRLLSDQDILKIGFAGAVKSGYIFHGLGGGGDSPV
jgi:hypothetical protein